MIVTNTPQSIETIANALREGKLAAIPTETVYGLAANALDEEAVKRIFKAKGRPAINPLIIHVSSLEQAEQYVDFSETAREVAEHFWPGPLTLILPQKKNCPIAKTASAGLTTLAVRMPSSPIAQNILKAAKLPLAAPSANKSGEPSPTTPQHVSQSLGDHVDFILAAGKCSAGLESTVLDLSEDIAVILRPGHVTSDDLEPVLGYLPAFDKGDHEKPKSPGQTLRHYAPNLPIRLNAVDVKKGEALLAFGSLKFMGIETGGYAKDLPTEKLKNLSDAGDLHEAAANLFSMLRELDCPDNSGIAVMSIPHHGIGLAINDRLEKAAKG